MAVTKKTHRRPATPKGVKEAEKVARQMYASLTQEGAPRATPTGYIMGACTVLKMLMEQATQQGGDHDKLKAYIQQVVDDM